MARRRRPGLTSAASGYRPAVHGVFRFRRAESLGRAGPAVARLAVAACPIGRVPPPSPTPPAETGPSGETFRAVCPCGVNALLATAAVWCPAAGIECRSGGRGVTAAVCGGF